MLQLLQLLASAAIAPPPAPALSAPTTTVSNAGTCPGPSSSATFHFGWTETSVNRTLHRVDVYSSGVLVQSDAPSTGYNDVISGWTITGPTGRTLFSRDYSAKLVRKSDSAVLSTITAATFSQTLGTC